MEMNDVDYFLNIPKHGSLADFLYKLPKESPK